MLRSRRRMLIAGIAAMIIIAVVIVVLDWEEVQQVASRASWPLVLPAIAFMGLSYFCVSYNFALVNEAFGIKVSIPDLIQIGFVSIVLGNILALGGAPQFVLRIMLMKPRGITISDIMAPSIFSAYINSLAMFALFPVGLAHLLATYPLTRPQLVGFGFVLAGAVIALFLATIIIFRPNLRRYLLNFVGRLAKIILRRDFSGAISNFDTNLTRGIIHMRGRPILFAFIFILIIADWLASLFALRFCFAALGIEVAFGVQVTGFVIGVTAGTLTFLPGGIGIQEGSMAGIYALLGVPFQQAILGAILFRVVYYFIPFVISLGFYRHLLRAGVVKEPP